MTAKTFHVVNFGCRASQSEGASISEALRTAGVAESDTPDGTDVVIVNSCTVTEEADREVARLIRRVARRNPTTDIVVTGCSAQRQPAELAALSRVRYVVGNSHKHQVPRLALDCIEDPGGSGRSEVFCSDIFELKEFPVTPHLGSGGRTRATLKVQDGCNANCSFCIIPSVRGRSRSLPVPRVVEQVSTLARRGYREVVFSGIHLGSYGRDLRPQASLPDLVARTLDSTPELERLRLSSIEPMEVTEELIDLVARHPRLAHHFHVPLQSGSARVLRAMRRPYAPEEYLEVVSRIRRAVPDSAIGADVMVGFPGETDAEFLETCDLVRSAPLTYLHVFPYSSRPGTAAATLGDPVPDHVAAFRGRRLRELIELENRKFRERFIGGFLDVLALEEPPSDGWRPGISDNFIKVDVPADLAPNRWHRLRIADLRGKGLRGVSDGAGGDQDSRTTTAAETV